MFKDAPKDDPYRFYISGGLEPLTNQGIGEIVNFGSEQGFKLSMYTNGFLLTPDLLKRHPGLWNLDTLRISHAAGILNVLETCVGFVRSDRSTNQRL